MTDQEISQATWTGIEFPGISHLVYKDTVNGYVLAQIKPWTVYQPGLHQLQKTANQLTYTNAAFDALGTGISRTSTAIATATGGGEIRVKSWSDERRVLELTGADGPATDSSPLE